MDLNVFLILNRFEAASRKTSVDLRNVTAAER
jgi:hypothetical protein